jgi:hypothetical protein
MNQHRAALGSTLHRVGKIPERNSLDVEVVSPAIHQTDLHLDSRLAASFRVMYDLIRARNCGRVVRMGGRICEQCQSSDDEQVIATSNHSPMHMDDRPSFTRSLTSEALLFNG